MPDNEIPEIKNPDVKPSRFLNAITLIIPTAILIVGVTLAVFCVKPIIGSEISDILDSRSTSHAAATSTSFIQFVRSIYGIQSLSGIVIKLYLSISLIVVVGFTINAIGSFFIERLFIGKLVLYPMDHLFGYRNRGVLHQMSYEHLRKPTLFLVISFIFIQCFLAFADVLGPQIVKEGTVLAYTATYFTWCIQHAWYIVGYVVVSWCVREAMRHMITRIVEARGQGHADGIPPKKPRLAFGLHKDVQTKWRLATWIARIITRLYFERQSPYRMRSHGGGILRRSLKFLYINRYLWIRVIVKTAICFILLPGLVFAWLYKHIYNHHQFPGSLQTMFVEKFKKRFGVGPFDVGTHAFWMCYGYAMTNKSKLNIAISEIHGLTILTRSLTASFACVFLVFVGLRCCYAADDANAIHMTGLNIGVMVSSMCLIFMGSRYYYYYFSQLNKNIFRIMIASE